MRVCASIYILISRLPTQTYININANKYMHTSIHIFTHTQFVQYKILNYEFKIY